MPTQPSDDCKDKPASLTVEDDEPMIEVPARILAISVNIIPCPHRGDDVCADCWDETREILLCYLTPGYHGEPDE